jgi:membrane fusion protein, multidrug efflux system
MQLGPKGHYVFVVKDDSIAELRQIEVKRTQGGESVVGNGLGAGETVVVDGQLRLVDGAPVAVRPPRSEPAVNSSLPPRG